MKTEAAQPSDKPKIPLPTLSQINADRITQVSEVIHFITLDNSMLNTTIIWSNFVPNTCI